MGDYQRRRPPCIKSDPSVFSAICGRPAPNGPGVFISPAFWFYASDADGVATCPECLSVMRHALEQSERATNNERAAG